MKNIKYFLLPIFLSFCFSSNNNETDSIRNEFGYIETEKDIEDNNFNFLINRELDLYSYDLSIGSSVPIKGNLRNNFNLVVSYKSPVFSQLDNSPLHSNNSKKLTLAQLLKSFFILKSPNNLFRRGIFIYKIVPLRYFLFHLFFDYFRLISRTIIIIMKRF